jgi:hypothetical protein
LQLSVYSQQLSGNRKDPMIDLYLNILGEVDKILCQSRKHAPDYAVCQELFSLTAVDWKLETAS